MKPTAPCAAFASRGDAPDTKLNWYVTHPPGKV